MLVPRSSFRAGSVAAQRVVGVQASQTGAGQLAQGLGDAANAADQIGNEIATAQAKEADATFSQEVRKALYEDGQGFLTRTGGNAVNSREEVTKQLQGRHDEILQGLSGRAKEKAQDSFFNRIEGAFQRIDTHTTAQRRQFLNDAGTARVNSAVEDAILDPENLDQNLRSAVSEIIQAGQRNGDPEEVVSQRIISAQTKIHSGVINRIAAHDPVEAAKYLRENKSKISGTEFSRLESALEPKVKEYKGRNLGRAAAGRAALSLQTRAVNKPSSETTNISLDFNASSSGKARGTLVVIPDNATPELRAGAEKFNGLVVAWAAKHGIDQPNRGIVTRSQNGRGVRNTVHTEPFFRSNIAFQKAIESDFEGFAQIYEEAFGDLPEAKIIPPHGVGRDRGATSPVFGDETSFGTRIVQSLINSREKPSEQNGGIGSILDIKDPDERDAALREFKLITSVEDNQRKARVEAASNEAFKFIEAGNDVSDLPLEFRQELGQSNLSSLRKYQDRIRSGQKVDTDSALFVELSHLAGDEPEAFSNVNLLQHRDKLDDGDFEKFVDLQRTIKTKGAGAAVKEAKIVDAPTASSLRTASKTALASAGIDPKDDIDKVAAFERELILWAENFTRQDNEKPSPLDIQKKVGELLTEVVLNENTFFGDKREGFAFEIDLDGDPVRSDDDITLTDLTDGSFSIKINDNDVPEQVIETLVSDFTARISRPPKAHELIQALSRMKAFQ